MSKTSRRRIPFEAPREMWAGFSRDAGGYWHVDWFDTDRDAAEAAAGGFGIYHHWVRYVLAAEPKKQKARRRG